MRHREGNVLKDQASCERLGAPPLNSVECGLFTFLSEQSLFDSNSQVPLIVFAMTLPENLNSLNRNKLLALMAALQRQVTELTATQERRCAPKLSHMYDDFRGTCCLHASALPNTGSDFLSLTIPNMSATHRKEEVPELFVLALGGVPCGNA
jgi:hypothetical protein